MDADPQLTPDHDVLPPLSRSQVKARIALTQGVISVLTLAVFIALFFSSDHLDSIGGYWLLFPTVAFWCGAGAALPGALGWIDARQGATMVGLRHSQVGAVLGGVSMVTVVLGMIAPIVLFMFLTESRPP